MTYRAIHDAIDGVADIIRDAGLQLPDELKRRDRREPKRADKVELEDKIIGATGRHWRRQRKVVKEWIESHYPDRKSTGGIITKDYQLPFDFEWDDDYAGDMLRFILVGVNGGIEIFKENIDLVLDYTMIDAPALEFAKKYSYELIKGIDKTTRDIVSKAIATFIETPGFTIGDLMSALPFGPVRAQMIAITEVTRAYASGQLLAGKELANEYPGVKAVKTWFTNNDDFVCDICEPLDGAEVDIDEPFESGDDEPPAHVNCRCWIDIRTRLDEGEPVPIPMMR